MGSWLNVADKYHTGIYKITNKVNGKCYVGKSVDVNRRLKQHYYELVKNEHYNYLLQHDFKIFGELAFDVTLLCECKEAILMITRAIFALKMMFGIKDIISRN